MMRGELLRGRASFFVETIRDFPDAFTHVKDVENADRWSNQNRCMSHNDRSRSSKQISVFFRWGSRCWHSNARLQNSHGRRP